MSVYSVIQGSITYPNQERLNAVVDMLTERGTMKDGMFVNEIGGRFSDDECINGFVLTIPIGNYRNFVHLLDEISKDTISYIVWTITDGQFCGGIIENGKDKIQYEDLTKWAKAHELEPPTKEESAKDGTDFDVDMVEWINEVEEEFHEYYS